MKLKFLQIRDNKLTRYFKRKRKYAPLLFFSGGFIWDSLTLGRIDRLYDITLLSSYMVLLTICLYLYNRVGDEKWKDSFFRKYEVYFPLAIQFFLGGLSSAFVIYFSRSVSMSKTVAFFAILVFLLFANEVFKKRISNKYLQFGTYSFVSFTFFAFIIPVLIKEINTAVFVISGIVSLSVTLFLIFYIYRFGTSLKNETSKKKLLFVVFSVYITISLFYFFRLIPPVPLALDQGLVAYNIEKEKGKYIVSYEANKWYIFWRDYRSNYNYSSGEKVYIFTSIFAPTDLNKKVYHLWKRYNVATENWETTDKISFTVIGGRAQGYRGYSYKSNVVNGDWKVEVITDEELVIGIVKFIISSKNTAEKRNIVTKVF